MKKIGINRLLSFLTGKKEKSGYNIFLELTNLCSARCQTCLNSTMTRPRGVMDFELFKRTVDTSAESGLFSNAELCGVGESYLVEGVQKYFDYAISAYSGRGVSTTIVTNGSHTSFIPEGISHVDISFNAGRKETYERITGLDFDNVVGNIKALARSGQLKDNTHIHMLVFEDNKTEIMDFARLFKDTPARLEFSFKYENQCDAIENKTLRPFRTSKRYPCFYPSRTVFATWDGTVIPCPHDFHASVVFGDLKTMPLSAVLASPARLDMIKRHKKRDFSGICRDCNYNVSFRGKIFSFKADRVLSDPAENAGFRAMMRTAGLEYKED
ncbi:MAG: SPASM domain-containing protein [Endomicrobiia bacterium]|nr:SPASM domain-containing protein [Endomicrobiia bacterium]